MRLYVVIHSYVALIVIEALENIVSNVVPGGIHSDHRSMFLFYHQSLWDRSRVVYDPEYFLSLGIRWDQSSWHAVCFKIHWDHSFITRSMYMSVFEVTFNWHFSTCQWFLFCHPKFRTKDQILLFPPPGRRLFPFLVPFFIYLGTLSCVIRKYKCDLRPGCAPLKVIIRASSMWFHILVK